MSIPFENKRFRINPIEVAVFAVVGLIFAKSGYNLIYTHDGGDTPTLTASAQDPIRSQDRVPAALPPMAASNFSEVKIGCDPSAVTAQVTSNKIRLIGSVCKPVENAAPKQDDTKTASASASSGDRDDGNDEANDGTTPPTHPLLSPQSQPGVAAATPEAAESVKTISVINTSARVSATVFPDFHNERFSTDYISLAPGKNTIHVQYEFKNGETLGQEFSVTKN
jgi:hypothetical protein